MDLSSRDELYMNTCDESSLNGEAENLSLMDLNSLPFPRKDCDRWHKEFHNHVPYQFLTMELFDQPPVIELDGPNDSSTLKKLQDYFSDRLNKKVKYTEAANAKTKQFATLLKERICHGDLYAAENQKLQAEIEQLRQDYADLNNKTYVLRRQNNSLSTLLAKYEANDANHRRRNEDVAKKAKARGALLEKQNHLFKKVEEVLDTRSSKTVATLRKKFDLAGEPVKQPYRRVAASPKKPSVSVHLQCRRSVSANPRVFQ